MAFSDPIMAPSILSSGVLLAAVYVVYWKISSYLSNKQFERFAEENGCKPPPVAPGDHGFARLRRILYVPASILMSRPGHLHTLRKMTESGEDLLDDLVAPAHVRAATVYLYGFEGSKVIQTVDPANLQAMLATQFDDFELGKRRYVRALEGMCRAVFRRRKMSCSESALATSPRGGVNKFETLQALSNRSGKTTSQL